MLQQELLQTLAEIAVTIAALSAVAGVVRSRPLSLVSAGLLRDVAIIGMLVALFSLLPLIFWNDETIVAFKLCALGAGSLWLLGYSVYLRGVYKDRSQITVVFWIGMAITMLGLGLLFACVRSDDHSGITLYLVGMLSWLAIAGLNFVASVFSNSK
ncbi:unnamed protein product, partial [Laminaria digitata]